MYRPSVKVKDKGSVGAYVNGTPSHSYGVSLATARLIVCLKKLIRPRFLRHVFFRYVLWLNDTSYNKSVLRDK